MASFYRQLRQVTFAAGANSGDQLELALLPANEDGATVYVRKVSLRLNGTFTSTGGGAANLARLLANVELKIPGISPALVNVGGSKLVRLFRERNGGERPPIAAPATWATALGAGANNIDLSIPVEFADQGARRFDDGAIPATLLRRGTLKVTFGALTDIIADGTAASLTLTVTFECVRKRELRCPPLPIIESVDISGTEPVISGKEGRITHAFLSPQADGLFLAAGDYAAVGVGFGTLKLTEDATDVGVFYDAFNATATTDIEKHTAAQTDRQSFIPLVFPPGGKQGQHVTFETVPAGYKPRIKTTVAANAYAYTTRYVLNMRSPAMAEAKRLMGLAGPTKALTASHKPTGAPEVTDFVPAKATA